MLFLMVSIHIFFSCFDGGREEGREGGREGGSEVE
jgi:hypothetical protein